LKAGLTGKELRAFHRQGAFFKKSGSGFVTSRPKQNFEKLVLVNHFPHETAFCIKTFFA